MHTGEDISITFKRNGRYDDEALKKLDWFLRDWRREQSTHMDPQLLDLVWEVSHEVGAKEPVQVVCGYRSPETNAMLRHRSRGVAQYSQHTVGRAMDFYIPGVSLEQVRIAGLRLQRGGVGFYPTSGSPFVHVDTGSVRHCPRAVESKPVRVAAVPIPPKAPPRPGQFTLAATTQNPADVIRARGTFTAAPAAAAVTAVAERADARAAAPPGAFNEGGQKLVWIAGPEGRPAPRPPQEIVVASADPEPTAGLGASSEFAKDRVPAEIALAYAATPT